MSAFPPRTIADFLQSCAGEWLTVRSRFQLQTSPDPEDGSAGEGLPEDPVPAANAEDWHAADKGALLVAYLEPLRAGEPGGLVVTPPESGGQRLPPVQLHFSAAGDFQSQGPAGEALDSGSWQLWPDGSLELTARGEHGVVRERIWFTKPNLRLRSSVERRDDGQPGRASFSSEIRRVARVAPSAP